LLRLLEAVALSLLLLWIAARRLPEGRLAFAEHFLQPFQLLSAAWGDDLSFQLGIAPVGLSIIAVALLLSKGARESTETPSSFPASSSMADAATQNEMTPALSLRRSVATACPERSDRKAISTVDRGDRFAHARGDSTHVIRSYLAGAAWFWVTALLIPILFCLPLSAWFWQLANFDAFLTHPWQLLALTGLPLAFLSGAVIRQEERLASLPAWAGLVALVVLASYPYLAPRFTQVDPGSEPVAMLQPIGAETPQIMLLDYDLVPPTEITPTLTLTLTWQALEPVTDDYTIFVHAFAQGTKVAQRDTRPCNGECPTTSWEPGRIIMDRYQLDLAPEAAAGPGQLPPVPDQLGVGLYLLDSGERATVVGRDDDTVLINVPQ
jgi:hypothetical protein